MDFSNLPEERGEDCRIDETARFGPNVRLGHKVVIEPYAVIHAGARLENNCHIRSHAVIGAAMSGFREKDCRLSASPCVIGSSSDIGPQTVIEGDVILGPRLRLGSHSTIRQGARIGAHFRAGSYIDIRGRCRIGEYVTCHSHVHISRGSVIQSFCWLMPYVVLLNDRYPPTELQEENTRIGEYSVIGAHSILFPGVVLGRHVIIGAGCQVKTSVDDYLIVAGPQGKIVGDSRFIPLKLGKEYCRPYPWTLHVAAGFPWEGSNPPT